jgi:hypothetical protein
MQIASNFAVMSLRAAQGSGLNTVRLREKPFGLSPSKPVDKLRANGPKRTVLGQVLVRHGNVANTSGGGSRPGNC